MDWIAAISRLSREDRGFVIVTVLSVEGSAPRDADTKMVVDAESVYDTIGGGNLEFKAVARARELLHGTGPNTTREQYSLGADLSQCCGGRVELLFECIRPKQFNVSLFGAGHVGQALATILAGLPCRLQWFDSRTEFADNARNMAGANTEVVHMSYPEQAVEVSPPDCWYLVMTHSHEIDMQLVESILARRDMAFCGLIGSRSKAAKFRNRLKRRQFSQEEIAHLTSPIGIEKVRGKRPMEVAVSVAAQILALRSQRLQIQSDEDERKSVVDLVRN